MDAIYVGSNIDKYTSLSNGVCVGNKGKKSNCSYIDSNYHDHSSLCNNQPIKVYAGETALSLICANNKEYQFTYYNQLKYDESAILEISCDTKNYRFWKTSLEKNNLSFIFLSSDELGVPSIYCMMLRNSETVIPIPITSVEINGDCPVGFNLTEKRICECTQILRNHGFECNINTQSFTSPPKYWVGFSYYVNGEGYALDTHIILSTHCPPNYCKSAPINTFKISSNHTPSDFHYCLNNRTGTLCGQCKKNYSVVFGSDTCYSHCSDLYLLTLPVYALAGLLLVIVLFALRLTVTTGTLNGVIFYANILELSLDVFSKGNIKFHLSSLRIIISLLNLNLGFPMCLYEGMTTAGKAGLQFVFPVYLWSIVLGLIVASRFSLRLSNLISVSSVQVLSTLFYLSFSKILLTAMYVISISTIFSFDGADELNPIFAGNISQNIWYYDGSIYGTSTHGFLLFVAAVFIVFFIFPYSVLLTFPYYMMRLKIINKFKPFFDAYGGSFKDKWSFWFGIRLWVTAVLLSIDSALQGTNPDKMLMAHFFIMLVFLLLQAHARPFRSQLVGVLDTFFLLNYFLIVTFYKVVPKSTFFSAYVVLFSSAVAVFFLIIIFHLLYYWIYLKKQEFFSSMKRKFSIKFRRREAVENAAVNHSDEDLFEAAENRDEVIDTY